MFAIIIFLLALVSCGLGLECGGPLSSIPFDDISAANQYYCECNFPTYKLDVNCLLSSCPCLKGRCPLTSGGCINHTAVNHIVSILNTCIGQKGLTCGLNMTRLPLVAITWTIAELVPANVATGSCVLKLGDGYMDVVTGAQFTVAPTQDNNISLLMEASMTSKAIYNCTFHVCPNSFLNLLLGSLPSGNCLNTPAVTGFYSLNLSAVVSMDPSTAIPTTVTLDDQSDISSEHSNFVNSAGEALNPKIVDLINSGFDLILDKSVAKTVAIEFMSTFAGLSLQGAQIGCP